MSSYSNSKNYIHRLHMFWHSIQGIETVDWLSFILDCCTIKFFRRIEWSRLLHLPKKRGIICLSNFILL